MMYAFQYLRETSNLTSKQLKLVKEYYFLKYSSIIFYKTARVSNQRMCDIATS